MCVCFVHCEGVSIECGGVSTVSVRMCVGPVVVNVNMDTLQICCSLCLECTQLCFNSYTQISGILYCSKYLYMSLLLRLY